MVEATFTITAVVMIKIAATVASLVKVPPAILRLTTVLTVVPTKNIMEHQNDAAKKA